MKRKVPVKTETGEGFIEEVWLSELNYLMVKIYYPSEKRWISYNLGVHKPGEDLFTKLINQK